MSLPFGCARPESTVDSRLTIQDFSAVTATPAAEPSADSALVLAARGGDRSAFGGLYARYAKMVHGILLARVPTHEVDDLVQDVFLKALPRIADLRDVTRFGPWLAAITRNCANDYYRRNRGADAVTDSLPEDDSDAPPAKNEVDAEAFLILEQVRSLPDAYRETLILRLVEGMTGPEIAVRTGLTPGSVRVNLHRGMQQLREKLAQAAPAKAMQANLTARRSAVSEKNSSSSKRNQP